MTPPARFWSYWILLSATTLVACADDAPAAPPGAAETTSALLTTTFEPTSSSAGVETSGDTTLRETDSDPNATAATSSHGSDATDGSSGASSSRDASESGVDTEPGRGNCGEIVCAGHSACVDADGGPTCVCDPGYVDDPSAPGTCIVDTHCIQFRDLGDGSCRYVADGQPAIGLFFAIEYCAGTAVLPAALAELGGVAEDRLGDAFRVTENGRDVAANPEAFHTIVDIDVESYVTLVLDVSGSVTENEDLPRLIRSIREHLLGALRPAPGEPDVVLSLFVFGDGVRLLVPATTDFDTVDRALQDLQETPESVYEDHLGPAGTDLILATRKGIVETERLRSLRRIVTRGGILTTGTVVVITDGRDESNDELSLLPETSTNVISIGISAEIRDEELQAIATSGSFLAPRPEDWAEAFAEIGQRVDEYPDRAYLLGYCSTTNRGETSIEVALAPTDGGDLDVNASNTIACNVNADYFSPLALRCDASTFARECDSKECGGITGCGACAADACCNSDRCVAPGTLEPCAGDDQLCRLDGEICVSLDSPISDTGDSDTGDTDSESGDTDGPEVDAASDGVCEPPSGPGAACDPGCAPGETFCRRNELDPEDEGTCEATLPLDYVCEFAAQCASLRCESRKPSNPLVPKTCLPPAKSGDACGPEVSVCEAGTYCDGAVCTPRKWDLELCGSASECASGVCRSPEGSNIALCMVDQACFFSWSEKISD